MEVKRETVVIKKYPFGIAPSEDLLGARYPYMTETARRCEKGVMHVERLDRPMNILYIFEYPVVNRTYQRSQ